MPKKIFDFLPSIISGAFGIGQQIWQNSFNKKEAEKNREFQSEEAEVNRIFQSNEAALQRDWSAAEAERARDWQEEMNAKYNSLSGKIAQAEQSGVNPLFAVTGNAVTPASAGGSIPSGASAGSVGTPSGATASMGLVNILGALMDARKIESEVAVNESIAQKNEAEAEVSLKKLASEIANIDSQTELNAQKVLESATSIEKIKSDMNLNERQAEVFASQINYLDSQANYINAIKEPEARLKQAQAVISEWQEKNKELFKGLEVGADVLNTLTNIGLGIFNAKTGRLFTDSPVVVPKDGQVFRPSSIVD